MAHCTHPRTLFALSPLAAAAALTLALPALAQDAAAPASDTATPTTTITVTGRTPAPAVSGFGNEPLSSTPISARVLGEAQLQDTGARDLRDITRLDASFSDAYNPEGYYGSLSARGYVLDNRFNYRRDGLPINGETVIGLENKAGIELLKGTSGIQAGTSAPGGLVNYTVKRPDRIVRSAFLGWRENGTVAAGADLSQRFGEDERYGLRLNVAGERLRPQTYSLHGERHLLALAGDVKLTRDTLLEVEVEHGRQSQPSVPGFSMLGPVVPDAHGIDPRINLNNQPWSQPVVFNNNTASVRLTQKLEGGWKATAHAMTQRLKTDDRLAYPYGCTQADGTYWEDRYCPDGTFDLYDYRSENEHRRSDALDLALSGGFATGSVEHQLTAGVLFTRFKSRLQNQAYNYAGLGSIYGPLPTTANPMAEDPNTNRDERSTEFYVRDAIQLTERLSGWLGLRHTRLSRSGIDTDGAVTTLPYDQSFTTPWAAVSYAFAPQHLVYASWGQGIESFVTPNLPEYSRPGAALPAQKSRQTEIGVKGRGPLDVQWSVAAFDIDRPVVTDTGEDYFVDGSQRHRGLEAVLERRAGAWQFAASAMALRARYEDGVDPTRNGLRPPNVPSRTLRLMVGHDVGALPGLNLQGWLVYEGDRTLQPAADSPRIGGWTRVDLAARYTQRLDGNTQLTWRAGVDNLFDRRAWRESPYQYGHIYLYPMAPRTLRASVQVDF
ncbi:TonB-dependent siderophore receptor [uncultured Azohydromonas sp.]|jgi:TonB-dependent siderophore receptor|uniref:TonB-dependent siderophore receptor n=1 Tax=uncultured Azohydromonas sp. TaxID=487342 RepID=UPI00261C42D3|nr:TonB-dependent siderophore receptor [uncultured Azohydromonas sp.]